MAPVGKGKGNPFGKPPAGKGAEVKPKKGKAY